MTAQAIALNGKTIASILQDPLNRDLLNSLRMFSEAAARYGLEIQVSSEQALSKLPEIPDPRKIMIKEHFDLWRRWIEPQNGEIGPIRIDREREIGFAKKALEHFGLNADESFWSTVSDGEIIEIYGPDGIQLYRSLTFFNYCGYSLLDISVHEWYVLWERPRTILEHMRSFTDDILTKPVGVTRMPFPRHAVREIMSTGLTHVFKPRAFVQDFMYMGSLHRHPLAPARGTICTSRVSLIAEGAEALNIEFV